jgi:hypothetical protein
MVLLAGGRRGRDRDSDGVATDIPDIMADRVQLQQVLMTAKSSARLLCAVTAHLFIIGGSLVPPSPCLPDR